MRKATDANQSLIVFTLRQVGCTVTDLHDVGRGCPDILVGYRGVNYLMEIKDGNKPPSKRKLTEAEMKWHQFWRGQVAIVKNVNEALEVVGAI